MARSGWSSANFLRYASGVVTAYPLTIAAWGYTSITGSGQHMVGLFTSGSVFNRNSFRLLLGTGDNVIADAASGAGTGNATTSTTISADTWFHACGVYTSATIRAAFLNGGGKGTDATNRTPTGINRTSVGLGDGSAASTPFAPAGTGYLAEVGIWDAALTDAEVAVLATGVSPLAVRPQSLVGYWPIIGRTSPEINYVDRTAVLSVQGTLSAAPHPRIFMPRTTKGRFVVPAAAGGFQPAWAQVASKTVVLGTGAF